jgi:subtilisin family serine protease
MATPHVTGAAALYKSVKPGATAAQVKAALTGSAIETPALLGKTVTGGRLDAQGALDK